MLKASNEILIMVYKKLFERIISTERYPSKWNTTLTRMIYKEGDREEQSNYRGISLASNLGKLFNSIIYTKINHFLETNKLIRQNKGGFRNDFRTCDHIFTLQTIVEKYTTKGNKLYTCFVDLIKTYDSVWRQGLIHKLSEIGVGKKLANIVSTMYRDTYTSIIHKDKVLPKISTNKGVKQEDNLSLVSVLVPSKSFQAIDFSPLKFPKVTHSPI